MKLECLSLSKYFHIALIASAIIDEKNRYNVNIAEVDHIFKQNTNANNGIIRFMTNFFFFDNSLLFKEYLTLNYA